MPIRIMVLLRGISAACASVMHAGSSAAAAAAAPPFSTSRRAARKPVVGLVIAVPPCACALLLFDRSRVGADCQPARAGAQATAHDVAYFARGWSTAAECAALFRPTLLRCYAATTR